MTKKNPFTYRLRSGRAILHSPFTRAAWRPMRRLALHAPTRQRWVASVVFVTFLPNMTGLASMLSVRAAVRSDESTAVQHTRALTAQEMQVIAGKQSSFIQQAGDGGGGGDPSNSNAGGDHPADAGVGMSCAACGNSGGTGARASMKTRNGNFSKTIVGVPGLGISLNFTIYENSIESYDGPLGKAWTHAYNITLQEAGDLSVTVMEADGTRHKWTHNADNSYTGEPGLFDTLTKDQTTTVFTLIRAGARERLFFSDSGAVRRPWRIEDRHAKGLNLNYNSSGGLSTLTDEAGRTITLAYDGNHHLITVTDPASHSASIYYDAANRLLSAVTDLGGYTTTYAYDANDNITSTADGGGNVTTYTYTGDNITGVKLPGRTAFQTVTTGTDGSGFPYRDYTNELGQYTRYTYSKDGAGNPTTLTKVTDPTGAVESYTYDANFNVLTRTDRAGNVWTYTYDSRGNRTLQYAPAWSGMTPVTTWTYGTNESRDMVVTVTDPGGHATVNTYNASGDLTQTTNALNQLTNYTENTLGLLTAVSGAGGSMNYEYDNGGTITKAYLTKITPPSGAYQQFAYSTVGDKTSVTIKDTAGTGTYVTSYSYDNLHRVTQVTFPLEAGESTSANIQTTYNCCHPTVVTDELGIKTQTNYRADGLVTSVVENYQATPTRTTTFTYDGAGQRLTIQDGLNFTTAYAYTARGEVSSITHPDPATGVSGSGSDIETYTYNGLGGVSQRKMATGTSEEQVTTYSYNPWGLLTLADYAPAGETDASFNYNIDGLRTSVTDAAGTQSFTYDALHRMLTHAQPVGGGATKTVSNTYNFEGVRVGATLSGLAGAWTFGYDGDHKITSVVNPWGFEFDWNYYPNGWLSRQDDPQYTTETGWVKIYTEYLRLKRGAVQAVKHWKSTYTETDGGEAEGQPLAWGGMPWEPWFLPLNGGGPTNDPWFFLTYTRNKSMDITQTVEDDYTSGTQLTGTTTFAYDNFHQLTSDGRSENLSYSTRTFTYNLAGSRASYSGSNWTNNGANQLTSAPTWGETYTYDKKGNMATKVAGSTSTYAYDYEQRLTTVTTGSNVTNFVFDFDGQRRRASGSGETDRWFVFDGATPLAEFATADGSLLTGYTPGATGIVGEHMSSGDFMYHADQLGSTRVVSDSTVTVARKQLNDAFGIETSTSGSFTTAHRYVSAKAYYTQSSTGLDLLGVRQYDPRLGRFTSRDPIGQGAGPNVFTYVNNNPVTRTDPSGESYGDASGNVKAPPFTPRPTGTKVTLPKEREWDLRKLPPFEPSPAPKLPVWVKLGIVVSVFLSLEQSGGLDPWEQGRGTICYYEGETTITKRNPSDPAGTWEVWRRCQYLCIDRDTGRTWHTFYEVPFIYPCPNPAFL